MSVEHMMGDSPCQFVPLAYVASSLQVRGVHVGQCQKEVPVFCGQDDLIPNRARFLPAGAYPCDGLARWCPIIHSLSDYRYPMGRGPAPPSLFESQSPFILGRDDTTARCVLRTNVCTGPMKPSCPATIYHSQCYCCRPDVSWSQQGACQLRVVPSGRRSR